MPGKGLFFPGYEVRFFSSLASSSFSGLDRYSYPCRARRDRSKSAAMACHTATIHCSNTYAYTNGTHTVNPTSFLNKNFDQHAKLHDHLPHDSCGLESRWDLSERSRVTVRPFKITGEPAEFQVCCCRQSLMLRSSACACVHDGCILACAFGLRGLLSPYANTPLLQRKLPPCTTMGRTGGDVEGLAIDAQITARNDP